MKGYPSMLRSDENMLKPVLPGLRLATPLSYTEEIRYTVYPTLCLVSIFWIIMIIQEVLTNHDLQLR